jgi:hypothetical protein
MSYFNRAFLFAVCCFLSVTVSTQSLNGLVKDGSNLTLPSAQVLLRNGEAIKAFAMTGADGTFTLDVTAADSDSSVVEIRYFGYAPRRIALKEIDLEEVFTVILKEQGVELKEVVVSAAALPKISKGDTLIYRTDAYRDGSEKKIEEVIAKLPGVEVDEEGKIKVKGKPLDRILVDGEDLFDKNYTLLSRNVPADLVDRIDVINNYQQDVLIGDLSTESEIVLNLNLDPEKKRPVFGEVGGQLGNNTTRAAHGNFFHFGKKAKAVNFSDYGTLGNSSSVGHVLLQSVQGLNGRQPTAGQTVLNSEATRSYRLIATEDYLENEAYGTAQTILTRLGKKAKNRMIFNLSGENYGLNDERLRENITPTKVDSFAQHNDYDYRTTRFWIMNDFDVLLNRKSRLDFRINLSGERNRALVNTLNEKTGGSGPEEIGTDLTERPLTYLSSLRYVRRLNPSTALRLSASLSKGNIKQQQNYRGTVYQELPGLPGVPEVAQVYNQNLNDLVLEADLLQELGKYKWNHTLGHRSNRTLTETSISPFGATPSSLEKYDYSLGETYLVSSLFRKIGRLDLRADLTLSYFSLNTSTLVNEDAIQYEQLALQPNVNVGYKINRRNKISVWAKSSRNSQRADELVATPYLAGGSMLSIGLDTSYLVRTHAAGLSYGYDNAFDQYSYGADLNYQRTPNGVRSSVATDDFVIVNKLIPGFTFSMSSASVRAAKYLSGSKINLKLNVNYTVMDDQLQLGGELVDFQTISRTINLQASKKIGSKLSYGLGAKYSDFTSRLSAGNSEQRQVKGKQELVYRPSKMTKLNIKHNAYFPRIGTENKAVHLLSGELNHEMKKQQLSIGGGIRNAFNVRTIEERSVSVYQRYGRTYQLRPRTVYIHLTKTF